MSRGADRHVMRRIAVAGPAGLTLTAREVEDLRTALAEMVAEADRAGYRRAMRELAAEERQVDLLDPEPRRRAGGANQRPETHNATALGGNERRKA